jgi:hypothetical protein
MRRSLKLFQYGTVAPCSNHTCSSWGNHYIGGDIYSLIGANCYCKSCIDNLIEQILEEYQQEEEVEELPLKTEDKELVVITKPPRKPREPLKTKPPKKAK